MGYKRLFTFVQFGRVVLDTGLKLLTLQTNDKSRVKLCIRHRNYKEKNCFYSYGLP